MPQLITLCAFWSEESGASAVEYAILVAVVATAIFAMTFPFDLTVIYALLSTQISTLIASAN